MTVRLCNWWIFLCTADRIEAQKREEIPLPLKSVIRSWWPSIPCIQGLLSGICWYNIIAQEYTAFAVAFCMLLDSWMLTFSSRFIQSERCTCDESQTRYPEWFKYFNFAPSVEVLWDYILRTRPKLQYREQSQNSLAVVRQLMVLRSSSLFAYMVLSGCSFDQDLYSSEEFFTRARCKISKIIFSSNT